ncbi:MAG: hypothetical protein SGPRY_009390, partial [Prymnesium sp.]
AIRLAHSAHRHAGYPCIVVQPSHNDHPSLDHPLLLRLRTPEALLPLCGTVGPADGYGWRRMQLHKWELWRTLSTLGLHIFAIDTDWMFRAADPVPSLLALPFDLYSYYDARPCCMLNTGATFLRSTPVTRALVLRAHNRSFGGWEQAVFSEELFLNREFASLRCCRTGCGRATLRAFPGHALAFVESHRNEAMNHTKQLLRREIEGPDACDNSSAPRYTLPPPNSSHHHFAWNPHASGWNTEIRGSGGGGGEWRGGGSHRYNEYQSKMSVGALAWGSRNRCNCHVFPREERLLCNALDPTFKV